MNKENIRDYQMVKGEPTNVLNYDISKTNSEYRYSLRDSIVFEEDSDDLQDQDDASDKGSAYQTELNGKYSFRHSFVSKDDVKDFPMSIDDDVKPDSRLMDDVIAIKKFEETKRENFNKDILIKADLSNEDKTFEPVYHHSFKDSIVFKQDLEDLYKNHTFQKGITIGPEVIQRSAVLQDINEENYVIVNKDSKSIYKKRKPIYKCNCGKIFLSKKCFNDHSCMKALVFICDHCEKRFNTKAQISRHVKIHLRGQKKKKSLKPLAISINSRRLPYDQECTRCRKKFRLKASLEKHMETHDKPHTVQDVHKCHICSKVYTLINNLKHHMKIHLGTAKIFKCDKCSKTYQSKEYLQYHYNSNHSDGNVNLRKELLTCRYCNKKHNNRSNCNRHEKLYCQDNPHIKVKGIKGTHSRIMTCDFCQKVYRHKQSLIDHIRLHMGIHKKKQKALVECALCSKKYTRKVNLKWHIDSEHLKVKNYHCSNCKKGFIRKWYLNWHEKKCLPQGSFQSGSA